jgi:phosphoribosyl-ATP pyrophosphohydrolase/phosphoribosyl-AMP cyclohydrolase
MIGLKMDAQGLLPAVLQDVDSGQVLMLGYMNKLALQRTLETGQVHFWSRSRCELWLKGATSGNFQQVVDLTLDCDGDALLVRVRPAGPICHTGRSSCFHNPLDAGEVLHDDRRIV